MMNLKNTESKDGKARISVEISKDQFEEAIEKVFRKSAKNIMVPGFRKGHAPRRIIEGMYGKTVFYEDAVNEIFPEVYKLAVTDQKLKAVGSPALADMSFDDAGNLTLVVETELYPEVKLGKYKGIEVAKDAVKVAEADVTAELNRMAERNARIQSVERKAKLGDTVVLDFEGFVGGKPFEGGKGEKFSLKLGSGQFIPGFEDALVGIKAGEDRDVNVTFPEQYDAKLAGKAATFKCKVHEVKETQIPAMDDEFAKDVSEFDTLAELKKDIKAKIKKQREDEAQGKFENDCVTAAAEKMECNVPECMIEEQVDKHMEQFAYQLQMNGMKMEDYAKMVGGDMAGMRKSMRPMAEKTVRANLLLSQIVVEEKLEVSEAEVEEELKKLAEQYHMELDKVKEAVSVDAVRSDLEAKKAIKVIADNAKAPKKSAEEKSAEEKPATKKAAKTADGEKKPAAKKTAKTAEEAPAAEKKPAAKKPAAKKPAKKTEE